MSQRNRSGRGSNRNNGSGHGEEVQLWESAKEKFHEIITGVNQENDNLTDLLKSDKKIAAAAQTGSHPALSDLNKMESHCRTGVRLSENNSNTIKQLIEQLTVLKGVQQAKESAQEGSAISSGPAARASGGGSRNRDPAPAATAMTASVYDFDAAEGSPVPSPVAASSNRKQRDRELGDRSSNRDSMPPKADSVEPQGSTGSGTAPSGGPASAGAAAASSSAAAAAAANAALSAAGRSKIVFSKGDQVAFKRKKEDPQAGDPPYDWILGEVVGVSGEGKSRRYKCLDVEPEESSKQKEYKTFASAMIPIPSEGQAAGLPRPENGKTVLALYPQTTAFYAADVVSTETEGGVVNLKFHGEHDSSTIHQVERRYVLEHRI